MQADLLTQLLNTMPPDQLGALIAKMNNPQGYLNDQQFEGRGLGYRGNIPVSMRNMRGAMGSGPISAVKG